VIGPSVNESARTEINYWLIKNIIVFVTGGGSGGGGGGGGGGSGGGGSGGFNE
jgi:hypothetical protein